MGSRILTEKDAKAQCGIEFKNYGSHIDNYPSLPYMTIACAIGMTKDEIDTFIVRLEESFVELTKKMKL
jgi:O-phospho-L-seryl-tRNASec:L-selenocysteinyl-tRNA synthase